MKSQTTQPEASAGPLTADELRMMDAYWRAANYLSVGQIYLLDNPLLKEPLKIEHVKPRLLGHWGTTPGLNFIYLHLNRLIKAQDLNVIYIAGPGGWLSSQDSRDPDRRGAGNRPANGAKDSD
jgi:xylulose-5-phosphate/fructose-6-phosphate phosphoketolase